MITNEYRYAMSLYRQDGTALGRVPIDMDWQPAVEYARFLGIRRGHLPPDARAPATSIEPLWADDATRPYICGFRVRVAAGDGDGAGTHCDVPTTYFHRLARQISTYFLEKGKLDAGEVFQYLVAAYPAEARPADAPPEKPGMLVEAVTPVLPLKTSPLGRFTGAARPHGEQDDQDMPVFIPHEVLAEATELSRQAGSLETGGVLIGHLHRADDAAVAEIFLEVTAQVPASHGRSELTKFTFTPETWTAVRKAIELRRKGEVQLGWWHSHSFQKTLCKDCEKKDDGSCRTTAAFMSPEDCSLHRTCFPRAFSVALVVAESPCTGLSRELFGWRLGTIAHRGYHVLRASRGNRRPEHPPVAVEGTHHGT